MKDVSLKIKTIFAYIPKVGFLRKGGISRKWKIFLEGSTNDLDDSGDGDLFFRLLYLVRFCPVRVRLAAALSLYYFHSVVARKGDENTIERGEKD